MFPFGAIIGGLLAGYSADFFGRKKSIFLVNIFVVITAALTIISKYVESYETVMAGRFFACMLGGSVSGVVPLYLSEVSPVNLRGFAGIMNQLTIVVGVLSSNIVGKTYIFGMEYYLILFVFFSFTKLFNLGNDNLWPLLGVMFLIPVLPNVLLFIFGVESPKYLFIKKNNKEEARKGFLILIKTFFFQLFKHNPILALFKLRNGNAELVEAEMVALKIERNRLSSLASLKWKDFIFNHTLRRPLVVAIVIQMSQKFGGNCFTLY